jgi:hypothetical protein
MGRESREGAPRPIPSRLRSETRSDQANSSGDSAPAITAAYVTLVDPLDINAWSGSNRHIALALEAHGVEMRYVGALRDPLATLKKVRYRLGEALGLPRYLADGSHLSARAYAHQAARRLDPDCNVVFSTGTIPLAYLETDLPMAFWADATMPAMLDFYPEYSNVSRRSMRVAQALERRALERVSLAMYASDWAADAAMEHYGIDPTKVAVVPFGANIESPPAEEIEQLARARPPGHCRMLFLAVDWDRKGGDIALDAARRLNDGGVPTTLVVAGCDPPTGQREPFVECRGFVDKRTETGRAELTRLLSESHVLIHPARAEAYGVALTEASAFGLPAVAAGVGGITTIIRDGRNGYTLPPGATGDEYAAVVRGIVEDRESMVSLARSCREEYDGRLNWEVASSAVVEQLEAIRP